MKTKTILAVAALLAAFNASAEPFTLEYSEEAPAGPVTFYGVDADQWADRLESDSLSDSFRQEIKKAIEAKLRKKKADEAGAVMISGGQHSSHVALAF